MFNIEEFDDKTTFRLSAQRKLVDRVVREIQIFLGKYESADLSDINLVARELLNNAIEHGCRNDPTHTILCEIKLLPGDLLELRVEDDGEGFDHAQAALTIPENPSQTRNRGLALANSYAEKIVFNDRGNSVTVYLSIPVPVVFEVETLDGVAVVTPSGDITAGVADALRELLVNLISDGRDRFRFDLKNVHDIDSIILSVFISFAKMLANAGAEDRPEIVNASPPLENLFHLTRMDRMYQVLSRNEKG